MRVSKQTVSEMMEVLADKMNLGIWDPDDDFLEEATERFNSLPLELVESINRIDGRALGNLVIHVSVINEFVNYLRREME